MNCKNCSQLVDGTFCKACGQNIKVTRIDLPNFLTEVSDSVFQINRGLFYTIKQLFTRPEYSISKFLNGKEKIILTFSLLGATGTTLIG